VTEELKKEALDYIASHDRGVIATCKQDKPRAASVLYAHDGFTLFVHTVAGTAKVRNVEVNSKVAFVIDDQAHEGWRLMKTLQYVGQAEILKNPDEQMRVAELYAKRFPIAKRALTPQGLATDQVLIKITPERIYYSDYSKGMGHIDKLTTF
jgi:nitroimidazol reductase NimA-like FMN-containing flavoprotein (pyridoxamine 5'-phosphate oxidase superfamily)